MSRGFFYTQATMPGAGTAVTNTVTRTSLSAAATAFEYPLPPSLLQNPGDMLCLVATGIISTVVTTPGTLTLDWSFGGTSIMSTGAMTLNAVAQTNTPWFLQIWASLIAPGTGTAATLRFTGAWLSPASIGAALGATGPGPGGQIVPYSGTATGASTTSSGFNSTTSNAVDLNATWSVANAANSIQLQQAVVWSPTATGF